MSRYDFLPEPAGPLMGPDHVELSAINSSQPFIHAVDTNYDSSMYGYDDHKSETKTKFKTPATELEDDLPFGKAVKKHPKIVGYFVGIIFIIAGMGLTIIIAGAITGCVSFTMAYGEKLNDEYYIPKDWLTIWQSVNPIGQCIGFLVGGWIQDKIGRKFTIMAGSVISGIGVGFLFFSSLLDAKSTMRILYACGIIITGISNGMIMTACQAYVSEVAPRSLQGPAMAMFPAFTLFGQLAGSGLIGATQDMTEKMAHQLAFAVQWIVAVAGLITSIVMPESPGFLIRRGLEARAVKATRRLFAPKTNPTVALEKIRAVVLEDMALTAHATYISCFRGADLRRTALSILAAIMPPLFGLDMLANCMPFLTDLGMKDPSTALIGGLAAGMIANGLGAWLMGRVGMRKMSLITLSLVTICWTAMGISGFWRGEIPQWVAAGSIIGVLVFAGLGAWPASYAWLGALSSLQLRALTQGIGGVANQALSAVLSGVMSQIYARDGLGLGAKYGFVYVIFCLIALALVFFLMPELNDRSVMEIDHMFAKRLPARKFKAYKFADGGSIGEETMPLARH
ncbi:unnamed protein product [Clonostachys solani]|uniref:Major facilitator superfamily (MFS) profile domain-containing protein n=1 Tax=Clonostachys solani TaxID=160281 RepID=A0A9N9VZN6_9HYPO|nr:unnamed protein product [Clonostachys solani]